MSKYTFYFIFVCSIFSCKNSKNTPDVSNIKVEASITRFDVDFFNVTKTVETKLPLLQTKYGKLFDYFLAKTSISDNLSLGVKPSIIVEDFIKIHQPLFDSSQVQFKNLNWLEKDFKKGFQYFKYYFPEFKEPKLFTIVDGFYAENPKSYYGIESGGDSLLISLQMFLGENFSAYDPNIYYGYLRRRFNKDNIVKNAFTALINQKFKPIDQDASLIEQIVDAGKRVYLLDKFLPTTPDEIKLGYTKKQLTGCYDNEQKIWTHFINENLLFENEMSITKEYVGENPFTKALGTDSPGNIANFVGWQIVKKYLEKNKNITPAQLMQTDNKKIYQEAKYKP